MRRGEQGGRKLRNELRLKFSEAMRNDKRRKNPKVEKQTLNFH
jgi:hypothetical protein